MMMRGLAGRFPYPCWKSMMRFNLKELEVVKKIPSSQFMPEIKV
jgi:hypothetical protein